MTPDDIEERIRRAIPHARMSVAGSDCSFELTVVSEHWQGHAQLSRQRAILALFGEELRSGALHALSIRALTPAELSASTTLVQLIQTPPQTLRG